MVNHAVQPFMNAWQACTERLQTLQRNGQKFLGYFCTYTPVEIVHAAGFTPIRLLGGAGMVEKAYNLTPDFICPYMRRCLEKALKGDFNYLSGVVQGYTCDAACGCINIWEANVDGALYHTIPMPYNDSPEARQFLRAALMDLVDRLKGIGGDFSISKLKQSLVLYNQIRACVVKLYDLRTQGRLPLNAAELLIIISAGFVTVPAAYLEMLKKLHKSIPQRSAAHAQGLPVLVSGSLIESPAYLSAVEACGGRIVADDLCTGLRHLDPLDREIRDPIDALIDRHMKRSMCPARARVRDRVKQLMVQIETSGARGVIFILQKYCTPHLADYPDLSRALKAVGVPSIMIEVDESWRLSGQLQTRLEGFFEILGAGHD
ncbi:2-hydroxyacyl-CoA dehydratase subunit D [Thermodesulfobacteriota bacterium]